jgi:phosphoribosylformimino-5-aminoimidazole carboxamide ribotide isomerase
LDLPARYSDTERCGPQFQHGCFNMNDTASDSGRQSLDSFQIIGVLDVRRGCAVHARAGHRDRYRVVDSVAGIPIPDGDPTRVARVYVEQLGIRSLYLADLDAIEGGRLQHTTIGAVAALGVRIDVDAGVRTEDAARAVVDSGATRVIVGLETLPSFRVLESIASGLGAQRVAFSVDLREGEPILSSEGRETIDGDAVSIARQAVSAGVETLIVVDLQRVGMEGGIDHALVVRMRRETPNSELIVGGGIRGPEELSTLHAIGCHGVLVATALHTGRIGRADIEARRGGTRHRIVG